MIYSYLNLTCWRDAFNKVDGEYLYVDSQSLQWLFWLYTGQTERVPGISIWNKFDKKTTLFLTAEKTQGLQTQIVLPWVEDNVSNELITEKIVSFVIANSSIKKIVIGISSPKQNKLARKINNELDGSVDIYCLGAAVGSELTNSKLPFWFLFLLKSPIRTTKKLVITMLEVLRITVIPSYNRKFRSAIILFENRKNLTFR